MIFENTTLTLHYYIYSDIISHADSNGVIPVAIHP